MDEDDDDVVAVGQSLELPFDLRSCALCAVLARPVLTE